MNNVTLKGKLGAGYADDRYTLPKGGEAGDILVKTETGSEWQKQEPATSTPDWDQNDSSASDYIKNRPCYASKTPNWSVIQQGTIDSAPSYVYISGGSYPSLYEQAMSFMGSVKGEFSIMIHNSDYSSVYEEKLTVVRDNTSVGKREYATSDNKITVQRTVTELNSTITFGDSSFAGQDYILRFNTPTLTYHPLDDGYIPDTIQRVGDYVESERVFEWDGDISGKTEYADRYGDKYYKVSDVSNLAMRDFWFAEITWVLADGTSQTGVIHPDGFYRTSNDKLIYLGNYSEIDTDVVCYSYATDGAIGEIGLFFKSYTTDDGGKYYASKIVLRKYRQVPSEASLNVGRYYLSGELDQGGICIGSPLNVSQGIFSMAQGYKTTASEYAAHAEGAYTEASEYAAHAEGAYTEASEYAAHAEGYETTASEYAAHAEGYETTASGEDSHAEGSYTIASGNHSHAEGYETTASEYAAHAEGYKTTASGEDSHAEGSYTIASGNSAHAEGIYIENSDGTELYTTASGNGSHAEGEGTQAIGKASHAEGGSKKAEGDYSHAEGEGTQAIGKASHAEGIDTTAQNDYSHAEGGNTRALNDYAHAEGVSSIANGYAAHAEGADSQAGGKGAHAEGYGTRASTDYQHAQGKYNIEDAQGKYAHIVGNGTSIDKRSNAHTLDWEGNAWYAGSVEGTEMIIKSSTPNSTKRFKISVNDDGLISATEVTT